MSARGHFIAQFHLRNFKADRAEVQSRLGREFRKRPHIWSWSPATETNELVPIRDSAQRDDLYAQTPVSTESGHTSTDEDYTDFRIEDSLSKVEGIVSPHFKSLRKRGDKCSIDSLGFIVEYMMIQFCRTPARLEAVSSALARAMNAALRANEQREDFTPELISFTLYGRDAIPGSTERYSAVNEHLSLHKRSVWGVTLNSADTLLRWGEQASWEILWAPPNSNFVIGDAPTVMLNPLDPTGLHDGLAFRGTELTMPLSPGVSICARWLPGGTHVRHRHAKAEEVDSLNARQFYRARDAVLGKYRMNPPGNIRELAYQPLSP